MAEPGLHRELAAIGRRGRGRGGTGDRQRTEAWLGRGLALAERIPTGIAHINDQTINDEAHAPFGGVSASGTGSRFRGAAANIEAFTETRWITARGDIGPYPF